VVDKHAIKGRRSSSWAGPTRLPTQHRARYRPSFEPWGIDPEQLVFKQSQGFPGHARVTWIFNLRGAARAASNAWTAGQGQGRTKREPRESLDRGLYEYDTSDGAADIMDVPRHHVPVAMDPESSISNSRAISRKSSTTTCRSSIRSDATGCLKRAAARVSSRGKCREHLESAV